MPLISGGKFVASISQVHMLISNGPLDICKTPAPPAPAPLPIPYPNIATSATPGPGYSTKTLVLATPACTKKSKVALSNGDQPGVAMGIISNMIMGMAQATMASMDVFIEGGAVVRTLDLGESNKGSPGNDPMATWQSLTAYVKDDDTMNLLCNVFCEVRAKGHNSKKKRFNYSNEAKKLTTGKGKYAKLFAEKGLAAEKSILVDVGPTVGKLLRGFGRKARDAAMIARRVARKGLTGSGIVNAAAATADVFLVRPDVGQMTNGKLTKIYDYKFDYKSGGHDDFMKGQDQAFKKATGENPTPVDLKTCNECKEAK